MGISSLRRYHKPLASTEAPALDPGTTETPAEAEAARLANEAQLAAEQAAQAAAANAHPNTIAAEPWRLVRFAKGDDNAEGEAYEGTFDTREEAAEYAELASVEDAEYSYTVVEQAPAQSVNPIIQEAGGVQSGPASTIPTEAPGVESEAGAEAAEVVVNEAVTVEAGEVVAGDNTPSTKHGELERPTRFGSKLNWLAYVAADPSGAPEGYEALNRDQLAELYLGPKG